MTLLENLFLRKNYNSQLILEQDGFLKITKTKKLDILKKKFDFILKNKYKSLYVNKFQKKLILNKESLESAVKFIFDKQFCDFLTSQTGFKYTIDFFGAYQNFSIPEAEKDLPWYANHYHLDKPNSKNLLKIFIPMSNIGINDGPLELLDINQTKEYLRNRQSLDKSKKIYLVGDLGDVFLCKLNLCLHRARIPDEGNATNLIMVQLNPSRRWYVNSKLYLRQFKREPKFTSLSSLFVARTPLNLKNNFK